LNMVLNFGGHAQVLTAMAPYTCLSCGTESGETIDILAERTALAKGSTPEKECRRCGGKLEFDETPESYFSFVSKYAAPGLTPNVARVLRAQNLYATSDVETEKPPRIIKLVHGAVTYFRIIGTVGALFRARPFLVGAEGEVVIDMAEVEHFDPLGQVEWRRLLKSLTSQVPSVTLVDLDESFLAVAGDSIATARNIAVWSVRVPYTCVDCKHKSAKSYVLNQGTWPFQFVEYVCSKCGGVARSDVTSEGVAAVRKASHLPPPASVNVVKQRDEILSRALTDANVAQAGDGAVASLSADDTILGKYKIVRRISSGGMAEVFAAKQVGIGGFEKPVALKRIQRQLLETRHLAIDMFLNEAKIAGRLMHPNIVQVLDVGEVNGALYLAMEYVRGKDLREIIKQQRVMNQPGLPLGEICFIIREVAQALHHAYWSADMVGNQLSVVHRDVSPHNIMLGFDGTVKLLDFGVAMSAVTESDETMIVGKWMYMSPEHTSNQAIDHRSDLFSLGIIFFLLVTGQMPFKGTDSKDVVRKVRAGQFTLPQEIVPSLPEPIANLITRMMMPNPEDRPQTGREVVTTLTELVRTLGIERSSASIGQYLGQLFPTERDETVVKEVPGTISATMPAPSTIPVPMAAAPQRYSATLLATPSPQPQVAPPPPASFAPPGPRPAPTPPAVFPRPSAEQPTYELTSKLRPVLIALSILAAAAIAFLLAQYA
ncbi:MAG TPA: serine/threonine-protein kinase, partial [Kofleriaceae bacterium]